MTDAPRSTRRTPSRFAARGAGQPAAPRLRSAGFARALCAVLLLAPVVMGARDCERVVVGHDCDGGPCGSAGGGAHHGEGCLYAGEHHDVGDSFPSDDGCNSCSCGEDGEVICTLRACADGCGGLAGVACPAGQYCNYPEDAQCGAADQTGTCAPLPQVCPQNYAPVCGCDDRTYGNACDAAGHGVSVAHGGECEQPPGGSGATCGGLAGHACPSGEYCSFSTAAHCGAADQTGTCHAIPDACDAIYDPVCGCDDQTYGNACEAALHGVSVGSSGECGGSGDACGGLAGLACDAGEYCRYAEDQSCGASDETGTCEAVPDACDAIYDPVCGCDGETHGNACEAALHGVSVAHSGECDGDGNGATCGGIAGLACADGEYCHYAADALCGAADQTGSCEPMPQACTKEYVPVCGCDDQTYGNACEAASHGISVAHEGECDGGGTGGATCGGIAGLGCGSGEYCHYPIDAQCGAADQTGRCEVMPGACTLEYNPVCGCDDTTYGNACAAAAAGVSVVHTGECG